jgi:hypothetical protein
LDVTRITHVRIIDVVGAIDPAFGRLDSSGRIINDPWPTAFSSSGFDLDAVGVLHQAVPEPTASVLLCVGVLILGNRGRRRAP